MNKYDHITALVPEGEHFDATAINEGVYFTEAHCANIETALLNATAAIATKDGLLQEAKDALTAQVAQHETEVAALKETATGMEAMQARIDSLEAENAALKQKPAGSFAQQDGVDDVPGAGGAGAFLTSYDEEAKALKVKLGK